MVGTPDEQLLLEPVRRVTAFERLAAGPADRAELQDDLDVSRATLHRVVTTLTDADLAVETDDGVALTPPLARRLPRRSWRTPTGWAPPSGSPRC